MAGPVLLLFSFRTATFATLVPIVRLPRMPTPVTAEPLINTAILETDTLPGSTVNISRANGSAWAPGDCVLNVPPQQFIRRWTHLEDQVRAKAGRLSL